MSRFVPSLALVPRIARGDIPAMARLISRAEAATSESRSALAEIYRRSGHAHVVGITGVPGSGKSTLVATLAASLRRSGQSVAIVAIDPSSPYSGGAILGDRIRMSEVAGDPGVYIRSMATRGEMGGMARATLDAVDILDVGGFDTIIIETVGVGQDEVEIVKASGTTIVVSAPGLGDDVQAIKAGMLEIADIHVVSKCDRADANRTLTDLKQMMTLGVKAGARSTWRVPVIGVSAYRGEGLDKLAAAIAAHAAATAGTEVESRRRESIAAFRLQKTAEGLLAAWFTAAAAPFQPALVRRLGSRDSDPYSLAEELLAATFKQG